MVVTCCHVQRRRSTPDVHFHGPVRWRTPSRQVLGAFPLAHGEIGENDQTSARTNISKHYVGEICMRPSLVGNSTEL